MGEKQLTLKEASERVGIAAKTIGRQCADGAVKAIKTPTTFNRFGYYWLIPESVLSEIVCNPVGRPKAKETA